MTEARILVVEDEIIVAEDIKKRLEELGYAVSSAVSSGKEALNRVEEDTPDLVLMDIVLEGEIDGIEAADCIRSQYYIPVVYLTAYADEETLEKAKVTGPYGYIIKPFTDRELHSTIEMALYRNQLEKRIEHLNAVLRAVQNVHQLISTEKDFSRMLQGVCSRLIETRGYYHAWAVLTDESGTPVTTAEAGIKIAAFIKTLNQGKLPHCGRRALMQSEVVIMKDVSSVSACCDCLLFNTYSTGAFATRLEYNNKMYGLLCVSLPSFLTTDAEELQLFRKVAEDIAFALYSTEVERERDKAEEELKREKEFSESIIETANALIVGLDTEGIVQIFNKAAERVTGYRKEDALGRPWFATCVPPRLRSEFSQYFALLLKEKAPTHTEGYILTQSKEERLISWNNTVMRDIYKGVSGIISIGEDITEPRRTQKVIESLNKAALQIQRLSTPEEITSVIAEELGKSGFRIIITQLDEEEKKFSVAYVTDSQKLSTVETLLGIPVAGREFPLSDVGRLEEIVRNRKASYTPDLKQVLLKKFHVSDQVISRLMDTVGWERVITAPLVIRNRVWGTLSVGSNLLTEDDVPAVTAFAHEASAALENAQLYQRLRKAHADLLDLTENLEKKVMERTEELMRANQLKSEFLANMSHEFRTPLNAILSFADLLLLELDGPVNEQQKQDLEMIKESGSDLLQLVNNLLDLSKIEAGKVELHVEPVDPAEVIAAVASQLTVKAVEKGLSLTTHVSEVPHVTADESRLKQVMRNLVENAVKFTDAGEVSIGAFSADKEVVFWVKDTGCGIEKEDQEIIFDKFRQAREGAKSGGTGLGLSVARELVELHGGRIWVESDVGKGSQFSFSMPAVL
jgi:PAS domain S-box-containing protein